MIRHAAIQQLSRDHHQALKQAIALKRATDATAAGLVTAFVAWFDAECQRHFEIEEQVLLPLYVGFIGVENSIEPVIVQVLREHVELRALIEQLRRGGAETVQVREVGQRLDAHVRLEERKLFPKIQRGLSDEQLWELAAAVERAGAT